MNNAINASGLMIRRASELDEGSLVILGGKISKVSKVIDLIKEYGVFISIQFEGGGCLIDRASQQFVCVAQ